MGRKNYYSVFKKKEIQALYNFMMENENNPHFAHLDDRIEHYIKAGFHNSLIIDLAEKKFNAGKPLRQVKHFITDAIAKGYSVEQAKAFVINSGFNKKTIKLAFKLNKKESKKYGKYTTKNISKPIRETPSSEVPYQELPEAPARTGIGEPRGEPRRNIRIEPIGRTTHPTTRVEPRTDTSNTTRAPTNRQVTRQRDLQIGSVEKPSKKSRYFG